MIQRIQSIYLMLATIALGFLLFIPIANYIGMGDELYVLQFKGLLIEGQNSELMPVATIFPLSFLIAITTLISFVTIFLFKSRVLQMRLSVFNILLNIGLCVLIIFYYYNPVVPMEAESKSLSLAVVLPLIAAILTFMAIKHIQKDVNLLKSYNRIR